MTDTQGGAKRDDNGPEEHGNMGVHPERGGTAQFLRLVGQQVRSRRLASGLTVQDLADRAGISRRMLTLVENGSANPSLVTVDKLARALNASFVSLIDRQSSRSIQVPERPLTVWRSNYGSSGILHVTAGRNGGPELWEWVLQPADRYDAEPDPPGSEELFFVLSGVLVVLLDSESAQLREGQSAQLATDQPYAFRSGTTEPVRFVRVVSIA
jgi:transcriptional regulator with XRE-family HTH domain